MYLRARRCMGLKFRRQHQIGGYIADFYCPEKKVVLEIDGGQHAGNVKDKQRDKYMEDMGIKVIRVWNNEVNGNIEAVLEFIMENIKQIGQKNRGNERVLKSGKRSH